MAGSLKKEIDAILMFETPKNEAHQIKQTLKKITKFLGESVGESIIVVLTHADSYKDNKQAMQKRIEKC